MNKKHTTCHSTPRQDQQTDNAHKHLQPPDDSIDHKKVERIRQQLASGQLRIDAARLAEQMLDAERSLFPEER